MNLHAWLDLPENKGRAVWLAERLGKTKGAVSQWRTEGVPLPLIPRIAKLTGNKVTRSAMLEHALMCRVAKAKQREEA